MSENILHREIDNQDLALLGIFIGYSLLANPMCRFVRSKTAVTRYILYKFGLGTYLERQVLNMKFALNFLFILMVSY